jgi:hypothetical protein
MADVMAALQAVLDAEGLPYSDKDDGDGGALALSVSDGDSGLSWRCAAHAIEDARHVVFFSVAPGNVPSEARAAVAEYLTRANYGLSIGNFEMDWSDGEVRCRTYVYVGQVAEMEELIRPVVVVNLGLMSRYLPGLIEVAGGRAQPAAAIAVAEAGHRAE